MRDGNETNRKNIEKMLVMVANGKLKPFVSRKYALNDFAAAFIAKGLKVCPMHL